VLELLTWENAVALLTLTGLEIVLGIDNVVFIAILAAKLPEHQRAKARQLGLALAMLVRIGLLFTISFIMQLTDPFMTIIGHPYSWRDIILIGGGLFLVAKAVHEMHDKLEGSRETIHQPRSTARFTSVITQIIALDIVFSLDSVITAVGMARDIWVMVAAIIISMGVMLAFAGGIARFIERHPTTKMLALAFLLLIGVVLAAEGFGAHIEKGYIYSAMAFALLVEMLNIRVKKVQAHAESP
jgi:predicted tellurium resistance membrane protein TerC